MILTGKTIPQLPQLSATTNTSIIPVHLLGTTYYSTIQDLIKSPPFGTFYQNLLPSTSNTLSIGSSNFRLSSITVNNIIATAITTTLINTNTVPTKNGTFAMLGDITGNTVGGGSQVFISTSNGNSTFRSLSSLTSDKLTISTSGNLVVFSAKTNTLLSSGTGNILFISSITSTNNIIQKSISEGTNISISDSGSGTITFNVSQFITGATNNGSGVELYQSSDTKTLSFKTLTSSTPNNLNITTSDGLVVFSSKTFYDSASNSGGGQQVLATNTIPNMTFRTLSSSTPNNLNITTNGDLIIFSATSTSSTGITGATNSNNGGIGIFKSADTQTLTFRTLSSTSESLLVVANGDGLITFTPRPKFSGSFSSMKIQNAINANTVYIMSAETTEHSNGITVLNNTKFKLPSAGTYNIQFSAQLEKTGNGSCEVDIWFRKNGNDHPRSNSQLFMSKNNNDKMVASWNYVDVITGNTDYFEIAWSSTSNDMRLYATSGLTNPIRPDIPSVIVTVFEV